MACSCASAIASRSDRLAFLAPRPPACGSTINRTAIKSAGETPVTRCIMPASSPVPPLRNVPRPIWRSSVPSPAIASTARRTVLRATPYSAARSRSAGRRPLADHSPAAIRPRNDPSTLLATILGKAVTPKDDHRERLSLKTGIENRRPREDSRLIEPIMDHYRAEISFCQLKFFLLLHRACNEIQNVDTLRRQ